jgi:hypothetical protein
MEAPHLKQNILESLLLGTASGKVLHLRAKGNPIEPEKNHFCQQRLRPAIRQIF